MQQNKRLDFPQGEAGRQALVELSGIERSTKEQCEHQHPGSSMATIAQDMRYGLRALHRNPGFAAVAMLSLALGIGAHHGATTPKHGNL